MLVQVHAPHFVAGLIIEGERCVEAAPILRKVALGKGSDELRAMFAKRGWRAIVVRTVEAASTVGGSRGIDSQAPRRSLILPLYLRLARAP
jgi:hypothetical protein